MVPACATGSPAVATDTQTTIAAVPACCVFAPLLCVLVKPCLLQNPGWHQNRPANSPQLGHTAVSPCHTHAAQLSSMAQLHMPSRASGLRRLSQQSQQPCCAVPLRLQSVSSRLTPCVGPAQASSSRPASVPVLRSASKRHRAVRVKVRGKTGGGWVQNMQ